MNTARINALAIALLLAPLAADAAEPWPAEAWQAAENLTHLDSDFRNNLSGAHWNPETRTLWVCLNGPGRFWALVEDEDGGFVVEREGDAVAEFSPGGDLEGITQADYGEPAVYLMNEAGDLIQKYDVSELGAVRRLAEWHIGAHVPTGGWAGSEGITFVPDEWLATNGFVDAAGQPYTSRNGMGGLMLVAHQAGGGVYAFDLAPEGGAFDFVGMYATARGESSGLEFDRSNGTLYIWHNTGGNFLELSDLTSYARADGTRRFTTTAEYAGPRSGNLEGFAATPAADGEGWSFIADDDNQDGAALTWYREFLPVALGNDRYAAWQNSPLAVAAPGVRANDSGVPDGAVLVSEPAHGTLLDLAPGDTFDGGFVYVPNPEFVGTDSFTYAAPGSGADGPVATVLLDVRRQFRDVGGGLGSLQDDAPTHLLVKKKPTRPVAMRLLR